MQQRERALVTGGAGMLGLELVSRLRERGSWVRVLDLNAVNVPGVETIVGDVRSAQEVAAACRDIDVVYHAAAAVWNPTSPAGIYHEVNVEGTRLLLDACLGAGVRRFLFTSSMDVVVDGRVPIVDGDESLHYPKRLPADPYSRSKIEAEQLVLGRNSPELATCVLRPTGMYGPRDKYHLPSFVALARGPLRIRLGNGSARFSHVYSENVAHAHILAADKLFPGSAVAGQCYFITDHKPDRNLFDFMAPLLEALGYRPARMAIPYSIAYLLATLSELVAPHSPFNRFSVVQTCVDHTFVHDKAARDFGYRPVVPAEEAFRRTVAWARSEWGSTAAK
ncbi:MAG TPA: NAD-dependent epimerase/dehydratase family protein [Spirochaetia bacterium]|nr:NAD-dependent epimerase/dehydratase family protein [Spirochaetia bacterium]